MTRDHGRTRMSPIFGGIRAMQTQQSCRFRPRAEKRWF